MTDPEDTKAGDKDIRTKLGVIAERNGVSFGAAGHLLAALVAGNGVQAQFNHPELGGLGQWSRGGMLMIGDMFNHGLKARVAALCSDAADLASQSVDAQPAAGQHQSQYQGSGAHHFGIQPTGSSNWWPKELGSPSATGAQNDMRYAFFPASRRLALSVAGEVTVYNTGDHLIGGFSQQQSGGQSISFSSQHGRIDLSQLEKLPATDTPSNADRPVAAAEDKTPNDKERSDRRSKPAAPLGDVESDIFETIERLASLHAKGILSDQEFEAKKRELLARL